MTNISGVLLLRGPPPSGAVHVRVALREVAMADASSAPVALVAFQVPAPVPQRVPFLLGAPGTPQLPRRWIFDATATCDASGRLAPGDYVLTHSIEWRDGPPHRGVTLPLDPVT